MPGGKPPKKPARRGRPPAPIAHEKSALSRLGRALRQVRQAAGMSLTEFAGESTYSEPHLSRVEHGKATPSRELVEAYEAQFHTDGLLLSHYQTVLDEQQEARLARRGVEPDAAVMPADRRTHSDPNDHSEFVKDLGARDGQAVEPRSTVKRGWRLRNAGSVVWKGRSLERIGSTSGPAVIASSHRVPIPDTDPGETVDVMVELTAPKLPCSAIAYWQMVDERGPCFPDRYPYGIYAELTVTASE